MSAISPRPSRPLPQPSLAGLEEPKPLRVVRKAASSVSLGSRRPLASQMETQDSFHRKFPSQYSARTLLQSPTQEGYGCESPTQSFSFQPYKAIRPLPPIPISPSFATPLTAPPTYRTMPWHTQPVRRPLPTPPRPLLEPSAPPPVRVCEPIPELPVQDTVVNIRPQIFLKVDSLFADDSASAISNGSPLVFTAPQMPSPITAQRKRVSKLTRHLGEPLPDFILNREAFIAATKEDKNGLIEKLGQLQLEVVVESATSSQEGSITESESLSEEGEEEEEEAEHAFSWPTIGGMTFRISRHGIGATKKWEREKGGKRWTEEDFSTVLDALRAL
ncbi:hypothetical protein BDQ12DRAFT_693249 [Crucibulum laeve]|uniref:Uncharacterized protein n=1 Tax=Crucibulum laeve TaxID=68775 RepID=A0A5C3LGN1_9AGAR|nr:hypothetical protein BDQ12DRAFT_693249 [Crucibulum laeve]